MAKDLTHAGRYQIISEIGRGSMGVVYCAYDPVIGRRVAIKRMLTERLKASEYREYKARFQREAQSAGVLNHPNILTIYDFGEEEDVLFLAMEYLEGKTLNKVIEEQGILPLEKVLSISEQVCSALDYAHSRKIVHRDIKPANLMLLESGLVKIMDFGIAKILSMGMTQTGQVLGTPNYMSPEQVTGRPVDGRSDIFSWGVILYELATGTKPFSADSVTTVLYKIVHENPIPPVELDKAIHPGLSRIITKALSKSPEERYQTCGQLVEDLKNFRKLGTGAVPSATVPLNVPALRMGGKPGTSPPRVPPLEALPPGIRVPTVRPGSVPPSPVPISAPRTEKAEQREASPVRWLLLGILIASALGAGAYYYLIGRHNFRFAFTQNEAGAKQMARPAVTSATPAAPAQTPQPSSAPTGSGASAASATPSGGKAGGNRASPTKPTREINTPVNRLNKRNVTEPKARPAVTPATQFGSLSVNSNIEGASITLDGNSQPDWVTPYTFSKLAAGDHTVTIARDGYEGISRYVTVEAGQPSVLNLTLTPPTGEMIVETKPPGIHAEVEIDGKSYGKSPVHAILPTGKHKATIKRPGKSPYTWSFVVAANQTKVYTFAMGLSSARTGTAIIRTIPPGASVSVDDQTLPDQTPVTIPLSAGRHVVILSMPGYQAVRKEIDIKPGQSAPIDVTLSH